jgi:hypothetical protein
LLRAQAVNELHQSSCEIHRHNNRSLQRTSSIDSNDQIIQHVTTEADQSAHEAIVDKHIYSKSDESNSYDESKSHDQANADNPTSSSSHQHSTFQTQSPSSSDNSKERAQKATINRTSLDSNSKARKLDQSNRPKQHRRSGQYSGKFRQQHRRQREQSWTGFRELVSPENLSGSERLYC